MDLSVIICSYNRSDRLQQVLLQLAKQESPPGVAWEIVIVDNNSTDSTRQMVQGFVQDRPGLHTKYVFEPIQGLAQARNRGITEAKGELLVFIDDDIRLGEGWLAAIGEVLSMKNYMGFGGRVIPVMPRELPRWFVLKGRYALTRGGIVVGYDLGDEMKECIAKKQSPIGANMFFRREAFAKFGLFRTDLGKRGNEVFFGEDVEFLSRLDRGGAKLLYVPRAVVYHPVDPARLHKRVFREYYYQIGRSRGYRNVYPGHAVRYWGVPRHLIRLLIENIGKAVGALLLFQGQRLFYYELEIRCLLGQVIECYKSGVSDARNRSHA